MSTQLDLLLVNPGGRKAVYQSLAGPLAAKEPPVWAGLMATFVRRKGFSVAVLDANALDLGPEEAAQQVVEYAPRLTAVVAYGHQPSASTQVMPTSGDICRSIKKLAPDAAVLLVGGHTAALPERTLEEEAVDFVCSGEGPYTLVDLLGALRSGEEDFALVRGLCYRREGVPSRTLPAPLVTELGDEMPGIAWDILPMDAYRAHNWHCFGGADRQPYAAIYTSLGCPHRCSFCCIQAPFKEGEALAGHLAEVNTYRCWGANTVLGELDTLVNRHGVRNVKFADELFVLNPKHVHGICDGIIERGYDLNIWAYARADSIRPDMPEKLRRAGVNWLALGIEAASARVRDDVDKGFDEAELFQTLGRVRDAGIYVIGNYIFGLPEDDADSMQRTLDLAMELNCEFANFYCAMAYPGSRLYTQALEQGWPLPDTWGGYSQHSVDTLPLPTRHLSAGDVLRFRDEAFNTYFRAPGYLTMIENTFGIGTCREIEEMSSHTLVRNHT